MPFPNYSNLVTYSTNGQLTPYGRAAELAHGTGYNPNDPRLLTDPNMAGGLHHTPQEYQAWLTANHGLSTGPAMLEPNPNPASQNPPTTSPTQAPTSVQNPQSPTPTQQPFDVSNLLNFLPSYLNQQMSNPFQASSYGQVGAQQQQNMYGLPSQGWGWNT